MVHAVEVSDNYLIITIHEYSNCMMHDDCITAVSQAKVYVLLKIFKPCLHFLNITLKRNTTNKLKTKWHIKSTSSEKYLNYKSNQP